MRTAPTRIIPTPTLWICIRRGTSCTNRQSRMMPLFTLETMPCRSLHEFTSPRIHQSTNPRIHESWPLCDGSAKCLAGRSRDANRLMAQPPSTSQLFSAKTRILFRSSGVSTESGAESISTRRILNPCSSARSCSSDSVISSGVGGRPANASRKSRRYA